MSNFKTSCNSYYADGTCDWDWVEIRYKINELELGGPRYCCSAAPPVIESDGNEMLVLFYSKTPLAYQYTSGLFSASYVFLGS